MEYLKITNLIQEDGAADYKGLDLKQIKPGTQIYPEYENTAYLGYKGDPVEHTDITPLSETEYHEVITTYNEYLETVPSPENDLKELHLELEELRQIIDTLIGGGDNE